MQSNFLFKTKPFVHQAEIFENSKDINNFAYLMEMGTGKSKVTIDVAAYLYSLARIQLLLVVAPNEVHRNWILREVPTHLPDWCNPRTAVWASNMRKAEKERYADIFDPEHIGLRVVAFNIEAFGVPERYFKQKAGKEVRSLLNAFSTMMVIDESTKIKTPGAQRTKRLITLGKHAPYKRILTGTPITKSPFDLYAQFAFLDRTILGFTNYYSFQNRYGVIEMRTNWKAKKEYREVVGYRHLDELTGKIQQHSIRKTKKECLDLPEKTYERRLVALTDDQRKAYNELKERSRAELMGTEFKVSNVLTKILRLQQILGGFFHQDLVDADENVEFINNSARYVSFFKDPKDNPRVKALLDVVDQVEGKIIIWARFVPEIKAIEKVLKDNYGRHSAVTFFGEVKKEDRTKAIDDFQSDGDDTPRFFVAQQHSGGYGLTLTKATTTIYYSNDYSLEARLQSEDRAHRIGQTENVLYVDFECLDTIDTMIIDALRKKKNIADTITKDNVSSWL